ncbi:inositol monophosphatase family protein [Kutzneria albida]|uniref:Inositol-1-monophosphatase n=1 Tax=Kutzneria albida DSM 43870 TaxID=1449976 RepID=W5W258_9PSEU|nr:inositol monophosphatase family protein [Kutzneria albida]AHH94885.1 putative monophosphatase [Kutzneria albida DSM 43870]
MRSAASLLNIAQTAVAIGVDLIKSSRPEYIQDKGDRDTVTEIDFEVERQIREYLQGATPEIGFLGEEEGVQAASGEAECFWTLDPVDGTANFVHGLPLCAVALALTCNSKAIVAVVATPFLDLHYSAAVGEGASVNGRPLKCSDTTELSKAIVSIGDYAVGENATDKNHKRIRLTTLLAENAERIRMFGSAAIDLVWVAEGRTDATVILSNKPWDTTAGVLIAREAGAIVVDVEGNPHTLESTATIAMTPALLDSLLPLVHAANLDGASG